jgi:hypothetical protein
MQSCESLSKSLGAAPSFTQPCWLFAAQAHSSQAAALIDTNRKAKIDASQVKLNAITRHAGRAPENNRIVPPQIWGAGALDPVLDVAGLSGVLELPIGP